MPKKDFPINNVDKLVASGKAIISGDRSVILSTVQSAIRSGQSTTFYVSREQGLAILRWYWTPRLSIRQRIPC